MLIVKFVNDKTGDPDWLVGNYDYYVYINDKLIEQGRVEEHNRLSGWQGLLACLTEKVWKEPE